MKLGQPNTAVEGEFKKITEAPQLPKSVPDSKLEPEVQSLISFIFDDSLIQQSVVSIGYDIKRLPLGQLDKETVLEGYKYLREIEKVLSGKVKGDLADLSSKFYTYIPHNFSMKHMSNFIINTLEKLKEKLDLIQNLVDINIAKNIVAERRKKQPQKKLATNPLDEKYEALNCQLEVLDSKSEERKIVEKYLENTKEGRKLKLIDLFRVEREGESQRYNP